MQEEWYRFVDIQWAPPVDEWDNIIGVGKLTVELYRWHVEKHTPKGVRLEGGKFVLRDARKRWACPTIEEALESFKARKKRQIKIHQATVRRAEKALAEISNPKFLERLLP